QGAWDATLVDRFPIRKSKRVDPEHPEMVVPVEPASYMEDWELLIEAVIEKSYEVADGSGRRMQIKATACDSGGQEGVTPMAYNFWRRLKDDEDGRGHHMRFQLVKGVPLPSAPRVKIAYPDSGRKDRKAGARGEIPILEINSNL